MNKAPSKIRQTPLTGYLDDFLSAESAAIRLGLKPGTLSRWRWRGRVAKDGIPGPPFFKLGRTVRYRARDLAEWAEASGPRLLTYQPDIGITDRMSLGRKYSKITRTRR